MVGVKVIGSDPDFQPELAAAGSRLAVVKFTMAGYVFFFFWLPGYFGHHGLLRVRFTFTVTIVILGICKNLSFK